MGTHLVLWIYIAEQHRQGGRSAAPVLGWSVLVGMLAGFVGGAFRWSIEHFQDGMAALRALGGDGTGLPLAISVASAALLVSISLVLVRRLAPEAGGSGIQFIEGALDGVLPLRWARVLGVKFGAGLLSPGLLVMAAFGAGIAIRDAIAGRFPEMALILLFAARFALTVICYSTGVPGGIFAPMVALGTIFGLWFADIVPRGFPAFDVAAGVFMVAGAGAFFSATVRAPLTGIVLAVELTGNFELILPVAITCISATLVAHALGGQPIYTTMLERALQGDSKTSGSAEGR